MKQLLGRRLPLLLVPLMLLPITACTSAPSAERPLTITGGGRSVAAAGLPEALAGCEWEDAMQSGPAFTPYSEPNFGAANADFTIPEGSTYSREQCEHAGWFRVSYQGHVGWNTLSNW